MHQHKITSIELSEGVVRCQTCDWTQPIKITVNGEHVNTDPAPAPTTAREALRLAWELAHPIHLGDVVPERTLLIMGDAETGEFTTDVLARGVVVRIEMPGVRTLDPLPEPEPEPEPDWLNAPAVLAACTYSEFEGGDGPQVTIHGPIFDGQKWECTECQMATEWSELEDVTPLWPKQQEEQPATRRMSSFHYDKPWGPKLGGTPA